MSERRKSLVREQIARATVALFTEKGVTATTGNDIAEAVGMSTRTLWRYFPTKESCVRPLLTSALDRMGEHLRTWPSGMSLVDHVESRGAFAEETERFEAPVSDLIRMARQEPGVMAVWLQVHHSAEQLFAKILAERDGDDPDSLQSRIRAATLNAALRVAAEEWADRQVLVAPPTLSRTIRAALVSAGWGDEPLAT